MLTFKTKMGVRGQIVIPKAIRESLGFGENKTILIEVEDKIIRLRPIRGEDIVASWAALAKQEGTDVTKNWVYGDRLYEEGF